MSNVRSAEAGPVLPEGTAVVEVPIIAANETGDVALPANAQFVTTVAGVQPVDVALVGAPIANLASFFAWVSNPATGVITVRFHADDTGIAAPADVTLFFRKAR